MNSGYCAGCEGTARSECLGALARIGLIKACWECWSACNLACRFCFRSHSKPLKTEAAILLLRALAAGGLSQLVFAGGDPSLRRDLLLLVRKARQLRLKTEVQTNAQYAPPRVIESLLEADLVGLSLDGANAKVHDALRSVRGNFQAVVSLLEMLEQKRKPVVVRTVISAANKGEAKKLAPLVSRYSVVRRWSLMQFSPIQVGYLHKDEFLIDDADFEESAVTARAEYRGDAEVDIYYEKQKTGTYLIVASDGDAYGRVAEPSAGKHPVIGNFLRNHLSRLAAELPFSFENHQRRFQDLMP